MTVGLETLDIPTPLELLQQLPLESKERAFIFHSRKTIEAILQGRDERKLLVVGPCSIHDTESTLEYALKFRELAQEVRSHLFLVMRTYFEKPRTSKGWKGLLYDPFLDGSYQIGYGLRWAREILLELARMGVAAGCEFLEVTSTHYLVDLITWGCIGARTSASQPHRQLASSLSLPIGFKNSTEGNILTGIHGMLSASLNHTFLGVDQKGELCRIHSKGNPHCHLVLRGGEENTNYDPQSISDAVKACKEEGVCQKIFVDCAHGNSKKRPRLQIPAFESVIDQIVAGNKNILGAMLESHLKEESQPITPYIHYGVSVTDPCLDWSTTEALIRSAFEKLSCSRMTYRE